VSDYLWSYGVFPLLCFESVRLSILLKTLFSNKYNTLRHWLFCIRFLYGMCANLIRGHTYYEHSVWP
jgi:hypothetical protein